MYYLDDYGKMIADKRRMAAFHGVMAKYISDGATVLDLGAGTGALSLLAAKLGAVRVYAVEENPIIRLLEKCAKANGCGDRIKVFNAASEEISIPEQVDVILADIRGALPLLPGSFKTMEDAITRFLKRGGRVIPCGDLIYAAPVVDDSARSRGKSLWLDHVLPVDLSSVFDFSVAQIQRSKAGPDQLLAPAIRVVEVSYGPRARIVNLGTTKVSVVRDGMFDGLAVWSDIVLDDDVLLSNAPHEDEMVYGRAMLPVSNPIKLLAGDILAIDLRVAVLNNGHVVWSWSGELTSDDSRSGWRFSETSLRERLLG